jgi:inosine-uridine nucleoside N-ribohydrolase
MTTTSSAVDRSATAGRPRVIVDCDPGHDDAVALVLAAHYADLVGITTVGGNAPLADVTTNALLTCQIFGIDVEVHAGADRPLVAPPRHAPEVHGVSGFAGPTLPELERTVASSEGIEYLIETIRGEEGLWLIPIGPLTNVALAFRQAPDLPGRLAGLSFMGGSATVGNHSAVAEFNVLVDPEAADIVLRSPLPIRMAGLDLTHQFIVDDALANDMASSGGPGATVLSDLVLSYLHHAEQRGAPRLGGLHDPCAVLAVTHPEVITFSDRHVAVELAGALTRGMTVVDQRRSGAAEPNVAHGHTLDHPTARRLTLEAIAARDRVVAERAGSGT